MHDVRYVLPTTVVCTYVTVRWWKNRGRDCFPWNVHVFPLWMACIKRRRVNDYAALVQPKMHVTGTYIALICWSKHFMWTAYMQHFGKHGHIVQQSRTFLTAKHAWKKKRSNVQAKRCLTQAFGHKEDRSDLFRATPYFEQRLILGRVILSNALF